MVIQLTAEEGTSVYIRTSKIIALCGPFKMTTLSDPIRELVLDGGSVHILDSALNTGAVLDAMEREENCGHQA